MTLKFILPVINNNTTAPYFSTGVAAGFPSPGEDYVEKNLDLNEYLINRPAATFFVRVIGDSMVGAGIHDNDLLVVDKSLEARDGSIVIAIVAGEFTVKRLKIKAGNISLLPENPAYDAIKILPEMEFEIWGVVSSVIRKIT
jgi:DNA polymerase V